MDSEFGFKTPVELFYSAQDAWTFTLEHIIQYGKNVSPRGQATKEIINNSFGFQLANPVCYHQIRKLSYKFMCAEALWIISGDNTAKGIVPYNKNIGAFSDNGFIFNGAYGPPFNEQLPYIVRTLTNDPDTRQAVMTIWNRRPESSKDIPCTVSLSWIIRQGILHCFVNMRSSDAWLGLPYDMFNFAMMTYKLANLLPKHIMPGVVFMNLTSSHLYEQHWELARQIIDTESDKQRVQYVTADWRIDGLEDYLERSRDGKAENFLNYWGFE